ncbi:hypothetical protein C0J52_23035 [Blattella germanica]|nr:hypothetical protein C0J52_23035 [Blattella germanica]
MKMAQSNKIDFGELSGDTEFCARINNFHASVDKVEDFLRIACDNDLYEKLSLDDKVKYDLFLSYSLNSLFWLYLRTQGEDPMKHSVKAEIDRVREYNSKAKQVQDRKKMPHIDVAAAERFIRSGLWQPKEKEKSVQDGRQQENMAVDEIVID